MNIFNRKKSETAHKSMRIRNHTAIFFRNALLRLHYIILCTLIGLLSACGGSGSAPSHSLSPAAAVGEKLFNDINLSASGAQACATCHNPNNAHAQANDLAVQLGGQNLDQLGFRAPPSLNYDNLIPLASFDATGNPVGGFDRDGRAATLAAQAQGPLLTSFEMGNSSGAEVVGKVKQAAYAAEFSSAFGAGIFDNPVQAFDRIAYALQQYQLESAAFHPYNSKYDQFLNGEVTLTSAEANGLALFNDPAKGNCASCHASAKVVDASLPAFTNFKFVNLGIPRNSGIPANADSSYFDLGLCGPDRLDLANRTNLCGAFKVPTLRNVATRNVFFHNGSFNDLTAAVTFLVQRDTNPASWYPQDSNGQVQKFNDLPAAYQANVDTQDAPFNRNPGMAPALSASEISDLVQFLGTLTDNYTAQP